MTISYTSLPLLLIAIVSLVLIFLIAQGDVGTQDQFNPIAAVILGDIIGAASSLIGTSLTNSHNMKVKKQELRHSLSVELINQ